MNPQRLLPLLAASLCSHRAGADEAAAGGAVSSTQLVQVLIGLFAVLALILLFAWLARNVFRIQPGNHGRLRILGGISMGSRDKVVLLQVGEQQLVLGVSPGRISTLHVLDEPLPEPGPTAANAPAFASLLSRYQPGRRAGDGE